MQRFSPSRRTYLRSGAAVFLTGIAGCTGSGGQSESTTTAKTSSQTTNPETTASTSTAEQSAEAPESLPEGVSATKFEWETVIENHVETLTSQNYGFHWREEIDVEEQTIFADVRILSNIDTERQLKVFTYKQESGTVTGATFLDGDTEYRKQTTDGKTKYDRETGKSFSTWHEGSHSGNATGTATMGEPLAFGEFAYQGSSTNLGQTVHTFELESLANGIEVSSADVTVGISEAGIIHNENTQMTFEIDGQSVNSRLEYQVTALGTVSIETPDWVSEMQS